MADSGLTDVKKLLRHVHDKMTSVETKLTTVDRELSTVKLDLRRLHGAVKAEKQAAYPIEFPLTEQELIAHFIAGLRDPQLRADLEQRRPSTLDEAMQLALELEHLYN